MRRMPWLRPQDYFVAELRARPEAVFEARTTLSWIMCRGVYQGRRLADLVLVHEDGMATAVEVLPDRTDKQAAVEHLHQTRDFIAAELGITDTLLKVAYYDGDVFSYDIVPNGTIGNAEAICTGMHAGYRNGMRRYTTGRDMTTHAEYLEALVTRLDAVDVQDEKWIMQDGVWFEEGSVHQRRLADLVVVHKDDSATALELKGSGKKNQKARVQLLDTQEFIQEQLGLRDVTLRIVHYQPKGQYTWFDVGLDDTSEP